MGAGNFDKIDWMEGQGTISSTSHYSYVDLRPPTGQLYYRLKQLDFSGDFSFSNEVEVKIEQARFQVFPNPVKDYVWVKNSGKEKVTIHLYEGLTGKLWKSFYPEDGETRINTSQLPSGIHMIEVTSGYQKWRKKIIKF